MRQLLIRSIIYMCSVYVEQALICGKAPSSHCDKQTGKCLSGKQCDPGCMGSDCQQVNIAYNASVENHHVDNGLNVVDGNESTCTTFTKGDGELAFLILDLGRKVNILQVDLVNPHPSDDSLLKFGISLRQDNGMFRPYYWYQPTENLAITEPVRKSEIFARFVRIEPNGTEGRSTLCEIEITGECDNSYRNCSIPCGHCAKGRQCNRITGNCDASGCADGWQTVKCDKNSYALREPVNVGVIAGTVSVVVAVIIVIVISSVMMKTRRRRKTTEKEKDTSSQNVDTIEHDISKAYYNTEDSRMQRSEPIHKTNINDMTRGPKVSGYEKLRDGMGTEELAYSVIDPGLTDNNGRSTLDNIFYYNDEFNQLEKR